MPPNSLSTRSDLLSQTITKFLTPNIQISPTSVNSILNRNRESITPMTVDDLFALNFIDPAIFESEPSDTANERLEEMKKDSSMV
jgi:hypothetical protein